MYLGYLNDSLLTDSWHYGMAAVHHANLGRVDASCSWARKAAHVAFEAGLPRLDEDDYGEPAEDIFGCGT
jgi:hypothetical protein